jgi:hypothetical protein
VSGHEYVWMRASHSARGLDSLSPVLRRPCLASHRLPEHTQDEGREAQASDPFAPLDLVNRPLHQTAATTTAFPTSAMNAIIHAPDAPPCKDSNTQSVIRIKNYDHEHCIAQHIDGGWSTPQARPYYDIHIDA